MATPSRKVKLSLADPYLKTTRAHVHLTALKAELEAFAESNPYTLAGEDDLEHGTYVIRFQMAEVPDLIPLIVGDFLYCLRSALDQTVWYLAKIGTPNPQHTQFPIIEVEHLSRRRFKHQTAGVPTDAVAIIKSLQPYLGGNEATVWSHLLWRLDRLCNIDKHRRIPTHGSALVLQNILPAPVPGLSSEALDRGGIVRIPLAYKGQVDFNPAATITVIFGDLSEGIGCDFAGLDAIYEFVAHSVIPRFTGFFK
jgi:hypothetical protein